MKKLYTLSFFLTTAIILIAAFTQPQVVHSNTSGAPGAGACTQCHSGTLQTSTNLDVFFFDTTSQLTSFNYIPGRTYLVSTELRNSSAARFGFALSSSAGTFSEDASDPSTQVIGSYATHTSSGSEGSSFSFFWTAPSSASGTINFQLYFNEANNNGGNSGDVIYSKVVQLPLNPNTGLPAVLSSKGIHVFPNPSHDWVSIDFELKAAASSQVRVMDMQGKVVYTFINEQLQSGLQHIVVPVSELPKGVYFMQLELNNEQVTRKILVQ